MLRTRFPRDLFTELERLQQLARQAPNPNEYSPSIRGAGGHGFPALNVGGTPSSIEIYAFAPGVPPEKIDVQLERGALSITGDRPIDRPDAEKAAIHIDERFAGRFRRVVNLPDDADPNAISATYRDGVLHISVRRRESAAPRRINVL